MKSKTIVQKAPEKIIEFGRVAANQLIDIVNKNQWAVPISGKNYLKFEAWQTLGRFFNYTVKTTSAEYITLGPSAGFEAKAVVLDAVGKIIGGAEAVCMNDEIKWKGKPLYALKSMAQTRACARSLRQILSWVVVLAGYQATPLEEMSAEITSQMNKEKKPSYSAPRQATETPGVQVNISVNSAQSKTKCPVCHTTNQYHSPTCPNNPKNKNQDQSGEVDVNDIPL